MRVFTTTLAVVALSGCYVVTEQPQLAGQDVRLTVLHTNDTWGYTEPCG